MHLPDGILSGHAEAVAAVAAAGGLGVAARAARREISEVPLGRVAAVGALIFAGQMVNVPVASGTSGHLIGAALAVALLGGGLGVLTVSAVVAIQALAFADGGVSSLGLNLVNMAIVPGVVAAAVLGRHQAHRTAELPRPGRRVAAAALLSTLAAATAFSVEYALGALGGESAATVIGQMLAVHLPIGLVELALTVGAVAAIRGVDARPAPIAAGSLAVAALVTPWASSAPDGLERVAIDRGFASLAGSHPLSGSPVAEYALSGVSPPALAIALAGATGVAVTLALLQAGHRLTSAAARIGA